MTTFATNRRASFDYFLSEEIVAGLVLIGTEIKPIREGRASLAEAYVAVRDDGLYLVGSHVGESRTSSQRDQHEPTRLRKLLLKNREIVKLMTSVEREGYTIVPIRLIEVHGHIKIVIALGKGKKNYDKRQTIADRDWKRDKARLMANK